MTTILHIKGMHCNSCKILIEDVCGEMQGIQSCVVNVQEGSATIEHNDSFDLEKVKQEIRNLGDYIVI